MKKEILLQLKKLIDVKSIVTLILTLLFFILACFQVIDGKSVMTIYTTVIAFYFGTQYQKKADSRIADTEDPEATTNEEEKKYE